MADLKLDILIVPTFNTLLLNVTDASVYPTTPPNVSGATIEIDVPGFGLVSKPFTVQSANIFNSSNLGISDEGEYLPLPDGIYKLTYSVAPAYENNVTKTILRVDKLQEKFDGAFMKLDMMECDRAIKTQSKVDLNTIYFFIQGAIAAANNCAVDEANKMYNKADKMLDTFLAKNCNCSGNNYMINFQ